MRPCILPLFAVLFLCGLTACGAADRDQSVALTSEINRQADDMRRTNQARVSFSYKPGSTMGDGTGPIGDYIVILRGTAGNGEVRVMEKGGQTHSTFQFPRVIVPNGLIEVEKVAGAPLAIVLTRVGGDIELTEIR
jgi:hypothetical protein